MKWLIMILFVSSFGWTSDFVPPLLPNLAFTWVGILSLIIFVISYYFIAAEELHNLDKAKPALFGGTLIFILIAVYYLLNYPMVDGTYGKEPSQEVKNLHWHIQHLILEIAEIFFFLFVAMTYIESMVHTGVFERLKYNLVSKGYTYKKLFWVTGFIAFFLSSIADNLTTALILSTVLITIEKKRVDFLVPAAINIVVAANAGGAWSPFGDITTLMAWTSGKGHFIDFLFLFPAAIMGYLMTAFLLSNFIPPNEQPDFDTSKENKPNVMEGANVVIGLGVFTIACAVMSHQILNIPAMWGMMFGLSLLKLYSFNIKIKQKQAQSSSEKVDIFQDKFDVFQMMTKVENNTLFFFFGILAGVGGLYALGWLALAAQVYNPALLGSTWSNIGVGFLSAVVDNVPVMSAVLKANPTMDISQWMLVTLTAGIGGSLISFGSAAGVGVMGKLHGIYTFTSHMKYAWTVILGYFTSLIVWYLQYQVLGLYIKY